MAEGLLIGAAQAARALEPVDDLKQLRAGHAGAGGDHEGLHAAFAVEHDGLRALAVLAGVEGGGVIGVLRRAVPGFGDERLQVRIGDGRGGGGVLGLQGNFAGLHVVLHGGGVDGLALCGGDERGDHFVGELGAGREVERRGARIALKRGNGGGGAGGVGLLRGLRGGADEADELLRGQAAVRRKANDQRAVLLPLGGEDGVAVRRAAVLREDGQHVGDGLADAVDLVAVKVVEHDVAVGVDEHRAGHGPVDAEDAHAGQAVDLPGGHGERAGGAGHGLTREEGAHDPGAVAAHADDLTAARVHGGIQIVGIVLTVGRCGEGKTRAGSAGNERGRAADGILRLGAAAVGNAREPEAQRVRAAHSFNHLRGAQAGNGERVGRGDDVARPVGGGGLHAHFLKLPVAVDCRSAVRCGTGAQQEHERQREGYHEGFQLHWERLLSPCLGVVNRIPHL